jgi:7,8-dihydro-6-hydroxymethylpterin dimethyltransferase
MIDKETKEMVPVPQFINVPQLLRDMQAVSDAGRGKWFSNFMMGLSLLRNYNSYQSPTHFTLKSLLEKFDKSLGLTGRDYGSVKGSRTREDIERRRKDRWNFLFIAGMWFQDLFNYDFRRTEMCIIPYGTQEGEISFCAYNTGVGWRNIIEDMHKNATVAKWYKEHGKHEIYAKGKNVALAEKERTLVINEDDANRARMRDDGPMTAAEEKRLMEKLFQEKVLGIKNGETKLVQLGRPKQQPVAGAVVKEAAAAAAHASSNNGRA